jgi:glycosyltransferase involved in cell wall biosynthesis
MPIGFVLKGYPRLSETFIAQEIHLLESRGFELEIFSLRGPREKERHPVHAKIRARVTYIPEYLSLRFLFPALRTAKRFPMGFLYALSHAAAFSAWRRSRSPWKRFLQAAWAIDSRGLGGKQSPVDHIHSHFLHTPTEFAFYLSRITGLSFSISAHAKDIYTSLPSEVRERVRAARFLMTCTHFNWKRIREIVGPRHEGKVHEVYHGVSLDAFPPPLRNPQNFPRPRLLTVARLVEKKGYGDVLKALSLLKARGLELHYDIYGEGELRPQVEAWVEEFGLGGQVTLHGAVAQDQVRRAYAEGGVFVLGSFETANGDRDGIPNSMAEAMSMELPVVATRVSGIPELVEPGVTGLLADPRNPENFAREVERLFKEPGLADRLGREARRKVAAVFDANCCIDRCVALLAPYARGSL